MHRVHSSLPFPLLVVHSCKGCLMPLMRPLDQLPFVLSGPMLRRVEPDSVSVFLALKFACRVTLNVFAGNEPLTTLVLFEGQAETVPLGQYLHVVCITAIPITGQSILQSGINYGYNLSFEQHLLSDTTDPGPGSTDLSLLGMLSTPHPLGYVAGKLPTFALPPSKLEDLNLLHGSCRKPHGGGRDMLALLDEIIASNLHPDRRPHQLVLTGDQIYSDDVALPLLGTIQATARELLAWTHEESIPYSDSTVTIDAPEVARGSARKNFIKTYSGYTSDHSEGHLMFLSESYLMYLMVWSPELWPRAENGSFDLDEGVAALGTGDANNSSLLTTVAEQRKNALEFAETLFQVRRALANVPVAMIFDDHEVTDDWFIHRDWHEGVRQIPCGRRLLRNALVAYAIFQDWGNQPYNYDGNELGGHLLDMAAWSQAEGRTSLHVIPDALDCHLAIAPLGTPCSTPRMTWHYRLAGPAHQIIVLDTRTWRAYPGAEKGAAALIGTAARQAQLGIWVEAGSTLATIVVSPAPVVGVRVVEEIAQRGLAAFNGSEGPEAADMETWGGERATFEALLNELTAFGRVILISGDVHYAFTNHIAYFRDDATRPPARIVQLCSSSLKNQDGQTKLLGTIGHPLRQVARVGWLGFTNGIQAGLANALRDAILVGIEQFPNPDRLFVNPIHLPDLDEIYFAITIENRLSAPAVLPSAWRWEHAILTSLVHPGGVSRTDWRYAVTFVNEARSRAERKLAMFDLNPAMTGRWTQIDAETLEWVLGDARSIVGYANLGQIRFVAEAGNPTARVTHRLFWYARDLNGQRLPVLMDTVHEVPFTLPTASERPELSR